MHFCQNLFLHNTGLSQISAQFLCCWWTSTISSDYCGNLSIKSLKKVTDIYCVSVLGYNGNGTNMCAGFVNPELKVTLTVRTKNWFITDTSFSFVSIQSEIDHYRYSIMWISFKVAWCVDIRVWFIFEASKWIKWWRCSS